MGASSTTESDAPPTEPRIPREGPENPDTAPAPYNATRVDFPDLNNTPLNLDDDVNADASAPSGATEDTSGPNDAGSGEADASEADASPDSG